MRWIVRSSLFVALLSIAAACGDDSSGTTAPSTTAAPGTTAATTTAAPGTTAATTTAPSTTAAPETTLAADAHPVFGLSWDAVWPAEGETAAYRVTTFEGDTLDLPARVEYGVEFMGGTFDRLVIGTAEPGSDGIAVYFDRSTPWVLGVKGIETFRTSVTTGPESIEFYEEPVAMSGLTPEGETQTIETTLLIQLGSGEPFPLGVTYEITPVSIDGSATVEAGTFDEVAVFEIVVGGELLGGGTFDAVLTVQSENLVLSMTGSSGFDAFELLEPWG
jgi:hypothetical protein